MPDLVSRPGLISAMSCDILYRCYQVHARIGTRFISLREIDLDNIANLPGYRITSSTEDQMLMNLEERTH